MYNNFSLEEMKEHIEVIKKSIAHWDENIALLEKNKGRSFHGKGVHKIAVAGNNKGNPRNWTYYDLILYGQEGCACCQFAKKKAGTPEDEYTVNCSYCPARIYSKTKCCLDNSKGPWDYFQNSLSDSDNKIGLKIILGAKKIRYWLLTALKGAQDKFKEGIQEELDSIFSELEKKSQERTQVDPAGLVKEIIKYKKDHIFIFKVKMSYGERSLLEKKLVIILDQKVFYIEKRKGGDKIFFEWDPIKSFFDHLKYAEFVCSYEGLTIDQWVNIFSSLYIEEEG